MMRSERARGSGARLPDASLIVRRTLASLVFLILAIAGCAPAATISSTRAVTIAEDFIASGQPSGTVLEQVAVGSPQDVGCAWRIQVDGLLVNTLRAGSTPGLIHAIVNVDKASGAATLFAQG
jgi:hypothetical protein